MSLELGLKGRVAVVTGGSRGIGRAIARGLAVQGVDLILLARGVEQLEETAADIRKANGVRVAAIAADVSSADSTNAAAAATSKDFPTVHIVVNNAGAPIRRTDRQILWPDSDWVGDINLKLVGMLRVVQSFLPRMPKDGNGRIINISGTGGSLVWAPALTTGLNNAAMNHVTTYLAQDLAGDRITVNAIIPGLVGTEARQVWAENMAKQQNVTKDEFVAGFCKRMGILAGRWAAMEEVADLAVFLASDRARYINGARLTLDGGMTVNARPA
jgi:NAD(P)-dependent dehydrogenase (short-subunit alcohol dehydrogenase family)